MATNTSSAAATALLLLPLLVLMLLAAGARADASEFSPPTARRAGSVPPPAPSTTTSIVAPEKKNCPLIRVPDLVDACRSPPGLRGCAAQCIVYHYRGGYCDMQPHGKPGDCFCMNCLSNQA